MLAGVEGGGTSFVLGVGPAPGEVTGRHVVRTTTPDATLAEVAAWLDEQADVEALGIGCFGPLDLDPSSPTHGHVTTTPKPGWEGADVLGALRRGRDLPSAIETDVNAAALAEHRSVDGPRPDPLVYLTIGTGVGGGVVVDGRPLHGLLHPEIGHVTVRRHPDDAGFGGTCPYHGDCVEGLVSGPAVAARFGRPGEELVDPAPAARLLGWYLAQVVVDVTYVLSPRRVVLGGGVAGMPGLLEATRAAAAERLAGALRHPLLDDGLEQYLVRSSLYPDAGLHGALALAAAVRDGTLPAA